jgi:hypothetical protein
MDEAIAYLTINNTGAGPQSFTRLSIFLEIEGG